MSKYAKPKKEEIMAEVSFDNGKNWFAPEETECLRAEIEQVGWDVVVSYMDDEAREKCHSVSDAEDDAEFLSDYLRMTDEDLIIG